jgi:hypothetical protein
MFIEAGLLTIGDYRFLFSLATGFQIDVYRGGIIDKTLIRYANS